MAVATQALPLTAIRAAAGAALAPVDADDPPVLVDVVDSVTPPALLLLWEDPWLTPGVPIGRTMGPCLWTARLMVLCVAGRLEPGAGIATLEQLVSHVFERLVADPDYLWPIATATAPRVFDIGGVPYLGARVTYEVPCTI